MTPLVRRVAQLLPIAAILGCFGARAQPVDAGFSPAADARTAAASTRRDGQRQVIDLNSGTQRVLRLPGVKAVTVDDPTVVRGRLLSPNQLLLVGWEGKPQRPDSSGTYRRGATLVTLHLKDETIQEIVVRVGWRQSTELLERADRAMARVAPDSYRLRSHYGEGLAVVLGGEAETQTDLEAVQRLAPELSQALGTEVRVELHLAPPRPAPSLLHAP